MCLTIISISDGTLPPKKLVSVTEVLLWLADMINHMLLQVLNVLMLRWCLLQKVFSYCSTQIASLLCHMT